MERRDIIREYDVNIQKLPDILIPIAEISSKLKIDNSLSINIIDRIKNLEKNVDNIYNKLQRSANDLKNDSDNIRNAANNMHKVITNEANNITLAYREYATKMASATQGVVNASKGVVGQLRAARVEMTPAMNYVKWHANEIRKGVGWFPGQLLNTYWAIAYIAWQGAGGQGSLISEIMEAFDQIGAAFNGLGGNFQILADTQMTEPKKLANIINASMSNIGNAVNNFTNSFVKMGDHLAGNLK